VLHRGRLWLLVALLSCGALAAILSGSLPVVRLDRLAAGASSPEAPGFARSPVAGDRSISPSTTQASPQATSFRPDSGLGYLGRVLLEDNFDDPKRSRLIAEQNDIATYAFVGGAYAISIKSPKHLAWSSFQGSYRDVDIEADIALDRNAEQSAAGIAFRYRDAGNFYFYRVSANGSYNLTLYYQGRQQALIDWTESPAINGRGQPNKLRVEALGDHIRLFVNGTLLDEVSDSSLREGEIALAATTFGKGDVTCRFDNVVIRGQS
jgi:hypothetical protein